MFYRIINIEWQRLAVKIRSFHVMSPSRYTSPLPQRTISFSRHSRRPSFLSRSLAVQFHTVVNTLLLFLTSSSILLTLSPPADELLSFRFAVASTATRMASFIIISRGCIHPLPLLLQPRYSFLRALPLHSPHLILHDHLLLSSLDSPSLEPFNRHSRTFASTSLSSPFPENLIMNDGVHRVYGGGGASWRFYLFFFFPSLLFLFSLIRHNFSLFLP